MDKSNKSFFPIFVNDVLVDESADVVTVLAVVFPADESIGIGTDGEEERPPPPKDGDIVVVVEAAVVVVVAATWK